jgi:hypothetical protein
MRVFAVLRDETIHELKVGCACGQHGQIFVHTPERQLDHDGMTSLFEEEHPRSLREVGLDEIELTIRQP